MNKLKVVTVVGARPQFVKASAVTHAFHETELINEVLVHTGQHHDPEMSDVFFRELDLPTPKYNLGVHGGSHGAMTGRMLMAVEEVLINENPDWVLVYGDTNSTLAGALAASKLHTPVAHVEAGLRSFNRSMPEEINRVLTDHVSTFLFCPTPTSVTNLRNEGITSGVVETGDVMLDVALWAKDRLSMGPVIQDLGLTDRPFVLFTVHRAENVNDLPRFERILRIVNELLTETTVVWPVHPRSRSLVLESMKPHPNLRLIEPVGFLTMCSLLASCDEVYTDSGGVQKEAYFFRKPCTTLRDETEWIETIEHGWNRLWPSSEFLPRKNIDVYGTGSAAKLVAKTLLNVHG